MKTEAASNNKQRKRSWTQPEKADTSSRATTSHESDGIMMTLVRFYVGPKGSKMGFGVSLL